MLLDEIKKQMFSAMKAKDEVKKEILRVAVGEITTEQARGQKEFGDDQVVKILKKLVKSNHESIAAGLQGEQKERLQAENKVLEAFLPKSLSVEQIVEALSAVTEPIKQAAGDGPATGIAMKHLKASGAMVDGRDVSQAVKKLRA